VRCRWQTRVVALGSREELLLDNNAGLELAPEIGHFFECVDTDRTPATDGQVARKVTAAVFDRYGRLAADDGNV
jgi:hypothetical protein